MVSARLGHLGNPGLMFDQGVVVEEGPPDLLLTNASHPRTRSFLQQLEH